MNPTQSEVVAIVGVVDWWPENVPVLPRNRSSRAFVRRLSFTTKAACGASLVSVWLFYNGDEIAVVPAAFRKGGACMATVEGAHTSIQNSIRQFASTIPRSVPSRTVFLL